MKKEVFAKYSPACLFFAGLVLWGLLLLWQKPVDVLKYFVVERPDTTQTTAITVFGNQKVRQTFFADDQFDTIEILLGSSYQGNRTGQFTVRLYDVSGSCIKEWNREQGSLQEGWSTFQIGQLMMPADEPYTIEVSAKKLDAGNSIQLLSVDSSIYEDENAAFAFCVYKSYPNLFAYAALILFAVTVLIWWKLRKRLIQITAPVILGGMGLCMLFVMAPAAAPDDGYHYTSALVLSNIMMGEEDIGRCDPEYMDFSEIPTNINANSAFVRVLQDAVDAKERSGGIEYIYGGWNVDRLYHPIEYLMPAVAITVGRVFGLNYIYLYYFGRLMNLLVYILLLLGAIRLMPKNKEIVLLVGALPMCLHQAVSFSYDVVLNGMSILFVAYVVRIAYTKMAVTWREILMLMIMGSILTPVKIVYGVLTLAVFIIPNECFSGRADRIRKTGVMYTGILVVVAATQWQVFLRLLRGESAMPMSAATYTMGFILEHPLGFMEMLTRTFICDSYRWICNGIGASLAGQNLPVSDYLIAGFFIILLLCASHQKGDGLRLCTVQKWIFAAICFLGTLGICLGALTWTAYGSEVIQGIQGRYFIPYMLPVLLCLDWEKICIRFERRNLFYVYWFLQLGVFCNIISQVVY